MSISRKAYEEFIEDHAFIPLSDEAYSVVGLCGETGEVAEWYKKVVMRGNTKKFTEEMLLAELGDVLHYLTRIALKHGWGLADVMENNYAKIKERTAR